MRIRHRKQIISTYADCALGAHRVKRLEVYGSSKNQFGGKDMSVISMKQLLEAGVHFGHQTRRWNPKMAEYIYTERNGIYIIDLQKSVGMVDDSIQRCKRYRC